MSANARKESVSYVTHRNGLSPHAVASYRFAHAIQEIEVQAVSRRLK